MQDRRRGEAPQDLPVPLFEAPLGMPGLLTPFFLLCSPACIHYYMLPLVSPSRANTGGLGILSLLLWQPTHNISYSMKLFLKTMLT